MYKMAKRLYFAYGSNMDRDQMYKRCPDSELVGAAKLEGWRFLINTVGVATVVPREDGVVHGLLWRISASDEKTLDGYEGVEHGMYRKEELDVEVTGGSTEKALIYISSDTEPGVPRPGYIERIISAAQEHGLPDKYQTELRSWRLNPSPRCF